MHPSIVLHRAPWLLSMAGPVIADGAVVLQDDSITAVDRFSVVKAQFPEAKIVDHPDCVLMPGLINAHIHLELSHLAYLADDVPGRDFTGWLTTMLAEREHQGVVGPAVEEAMRTTLQGQFAGGVIALADIGNTGLNLALADTFSGLLFPFVEYLGLTRASLVPALKKLGRQDDHVACTAHAPYSTHPELIRALKRRADAFGFLFPIHVAEPAAESDLLCEGRGELVRFLRERGFYEDVFQRPAIDIGGSVQYLQSLGVLNKKTLCVHVVHVNAEEIGMLQESGAGICLCPGSNRFLQVGKAPVAEYLVHGILPALGTDSAASNPELSIWREMRILAEDHPEIDPYDILRMATVGGAGALGIEAGYGTLEQGKNGHFLAVSVNPEVKREQEVCEVLVREGGRRQIQWVSG
jgi:cytosine/adenosine deaminase-related metal-dependent hydrolase